MFPNGYNVPYYSLYSTPPMNIGMGIRTIPKSGGLFSKIGLLKGANWQGLLNNTSRTLGVINQAIPVVKQVGPLYNNMKSMLKIASLFKDETDPIPKKTNNTIISNNKTSIKKDEKENTITNNNYSNSPNFFI